MSLRMMGEGTGADMTGYKGPESREERIARMKAEHKVHREVYDRVMVVVRNGRQTSNPEEMWDAIFGHPNVKVVL